MLVLPLEAVFVKYAKDEHFSHGQVGPKTYGGDRLADHACFNGAPGAEGYIFDVDEQKIVARYKYEEYSEGRRSFFCVKCLRQFASAEPNSRVCNECEDENVSKE